MTTTPTSGAAIQPVLWVSPEQFANFMDADEAQFGRYVPARKTSAGNFTMPLFAALAPAQPAAEASRFGSPELQAMIIARCVEKDQADSVQAAQVGAVESNTADAAPTQGATEMENLQRTAVGWQGRALRAERNWAVCRRWAIAGGAPVEKLGDDPNQPFHAASPAIDATRKQGENHDR